jgi:hypothetical protein
MREYATWGVEKKFYKSVIEQFKERINSEDIRRMRIYC